MTIKGKISFTIKENHPDIACVADYSPNRRLEFEDTYRFANDITEDGAIEYVKWDLSTVAGGGYNNKYISDVNYDIRVIDGCNAIV